MKLVKVILIDANKESIEYLETDSSFDLVSGPGSHDHGTLVINPDGSGIGLVTTLIYDSTKSVVLRDCHPMGDRVLLYGFNTEGHTCSLTESVFETIIHNNNVTFIDVLEAASRLEAEFGPGLCKVTNFDTTDEMLNRDRPQSSPIYGAVKDGQAIRLVFPLRAR